MNGSDWISIAAIGSSSLLTALSLVLVYRQRFASLRDNLHSRQIAVISKILPLVQQVYRSVLLGTILTKNEYPHGLDAISNDVQKALWKLDDELAFLPSEFLAAVGTFRRSAQSFTDYASESGGEWSDEKKQHFETTYETVVNLARLTIGVDALSAEVQKNLKTNFRPALIKALNSERMLSDGA